MQGVPHLLRLLLSTTTSASSSSGKGCETCQHAETKHAEGLCLMSTAAAQWPSFNSRLHVCESHALVSRQQHCPAAHNTGGELQASIQGAERAAASEQLQSAWHNVVQCAGSSSYHKKTAADINHHEIGTNFSQMCQILTRKIASMHASCHELPPMNHQPASQLVPPHPVLQESPAAYLPLHPRPVSSCTRSLQSSTVRLIV
jgi:hypothetical protein